MAIKKPGNVFTAGFDTFKDIITAKIAFDFISLLELIDKQSFRNWLLDSAFNEKFINKENLIITKACIVLNTILLLYIQ